MLLTKMLQTFGEYLVLMGRVFSRPERLRMFWKRYVKEMAALGVDSIIIVLPKIVGMLTMIPLLVIFSTTSGIVGAYATAYIGHIITPAHLTEGIQYDFNQWYFWMGVIKSFFFAFIIATVSAFYGYRVEGGSVEVGKASTDAVVSSSMLVLFSDLFLTQLLS